MENNPTLQNIIDEKTLCELLGLKKEALGVLRREKGLPFLKISTRSRVYLESDLVSWLTSRRVVLNKDEIDTE